MKRVATITFHRAHNFGSILQTYALQSYVKALLTEVDELAEYKVIDLFKKDQEQLYDVFKKNKNLKNLIKNLIVLPYARALKIKHNKFRAFLGEYFSLTERYENEEELLKNPPIADYYISGSDQIWNVRARDFSSSYYLDFVRNGKKISYAASFGPLKINWEQYNKERVSNLLKQYDYISVRENGSVDNVKELIGEDCNINIDPTLLLTIDQWREIQSDENYNHGKYILLYCLEPTKKQLKMADVISKKVNLPIVILRYNNKNDMFNHYIKRYDAGPKDFLSYIDHAALVLSSSFHGTVFSLIYHKPFYVFQGMKDNRISTLLKKTGMSERSIDEITDVERVDLSEPDVQKIEKVLIDERNRSREYLKKALEIGKGN